LVPRGTPSQGGRDDGQGELLSTSRPAKKKKKSTPRTVDPPRGRERQVISFPARAHSETGGKDFFFFQGARKGRPAKKYSPERDTPYAVGIDPWFRNPGTFFGPFRCNRSGEVGRPPDKGGTIHLQGGRTKKGTPSPTASPPGVAFPTEKKPDFAGAAPKPTKPPGAPQHRGKPAGGRCRRGAPGRRPSKSQGDGPFEPGPAPHRALGTGPPKAVAGPATWRYPKIPGGPKKRTTKRPSGSGLDPGDVSVRR